MTQQTKYWNRKFGIGALVVAVLLAVGLRCGYRWLEEVDSDLFACEGTGNLLVYYMSTHEERWPKGWQDLRAVHKEFEATGLYAGDIHDLERRVEIDFNFDPAPYLAHKKQFPIPRVAWSRSRLRLEYAVRNRVQSHIQNLPGFSTTTQP